tara:strand:- start:41 stop:967 length:927 start_codon:yes stop_codon:yes gene_type:complete
MKRISIIIPVYNGELSIAKLVNTLISELKNNYDLEIILVNDNSKDNSEKECIKLYNNNNNLVKFFSLAKNVGEHNAVMAGLNHISGDYAVIMDDDFQNPISEVKKLISFAIENSFDVVYTFYRNKKHSLFRNFGSWFNGKVANLMLKKPKDLYLSSFKIMNNYIVKEIIKYDLPYPYIDGLILQSTDNIGKIEVEHRSRKSGESGYTLKKLISLWLNMFTNFSILPLRFSIIIGFFFAIIGFIIGIQTVIEKIMNPNLPVGYPTLIVVIAIFSGIQLIAIGTIGEYIGRIFMAQNKKPQYSIRKRFEK